MFVKGLFAPCWLIFKAECGRFATQRIATAPAKRSLPLVARFLAEKTTFSPLAVSPLAVQIGV